MYSDIVIFIVVFVSVTALNVFLKYNHWYFKIYIKHLSKKSLEELRDMINKQLETSDYER